MRAFALIFFITSIIFCVLWALARNDCKHERATSIEISNQNKELFNWQIEARAKILQYEDIASWIPGEVWDDKIEKLRHFVLLHRRCGKIN